MYRIYLSKMCLALLLFLFMEAGAQERTYVFKEGLILRNVHKYGREAVYSDPLALQLYKGQLRQPSAGSSLPGADSRWESAHADSSGKFGGPGYWGRGYLYLNYRSATEQTVLLNISGNSAVYVNGELHFGDPYSAGWMYIPVKLKKGLNEFYVRGEYSRARMIFNPPVVAFKGEDLTAPDARQGNDNSNLKAAVVIVNSSDRELKNLLLRALVKGKSRTLKAAPVPAMSSRKLVFAFDASAVKEPGDFECRVELLRGSDLLAAEVLQLSCVSPQDKYKATFESDIDGSLQYYAVSPQSGGSRENASLFLSVHGAGVEAIGQAKAYSAKSWGTLVAPTNRRPRGFNWEDWGRLDAMEVLSIARKEFHPDPDKIYLTGHSMGGHGTWFLGASYPGNWAAIAPCAGYPTLKGYGSADGLVPGEGADPIESVLLRSSNQSDIPALATNYKAFGIYINHGDADPVVSVDYARQMKKQLAEFHSDFAYYEYPGGNHWYGNESVDWPPLFDFFRTHRRLADTSVNVVDFKTASPGIAASYRWVSVLQQIHSLKYSRISLRRDLKKCEISGSTENVAVLSIALDDFDKAGPILVKLDSGAPIRVMKKTVNDTLTLLKKGGGWALGSRPSPAEKGPHRYGTFKDPFSKRMLFVYGTRGDESENKWSIAKARYDAEAWYYRGNGAVDIIADKEYSASRYKGRNVILYGNSKTNSVYKQLLKGCPVRVDDNKVLVGGKVWKGRDLAAYFIWPVSGSADNSVAVIAGSGLQGMQAADANQYFAGASGFPDFTVFSRELLKDGRSGLKSAGFYDMRWSLGNDMESAE